MADEFDMIQLQEVLERLHAGLCPVVQGEGPRREHGRLTHFDPVHYDFYDAVSALLLEHRPREELLSAVQGPALQFPLSWTDVVETIQHVHRAFGEPGEQISGYSVTDIEDLCHTLLQPQVFVVVEHFIERGLLCPRGDLRGHLHS